MINLNALKKWYETLNTQSLHEIETFYKEEAFFKDPFNEVTGREKIEKIFEHMFEKMQDPRFVIVEMFQENEQAFLTWDFVFTMNSREYKIHGSSHLKISESKIIYHRDYWDVGEELLLKLPLVKQVYGFFQKQLSTKI